MTPRLGAANIVSLLRKAGRGVELLGTTWMTFLPDPSLIPEALSVADGARLAARASTEAIAVTFHDRTAEDADWG